MTRTLGVALFCLAAPAATATPPTFNRDVALIVFNRCAACHRPNEVGPFALLTYTDVRKRADQIARVVGERVMPPWKPQPGHGDFQQARRLSDAEIATVRAWAAAGAPEGRREETPVPPRFPEGWKLGKPDLILRVPEAFRVPADGPDVYRHFVFPLDLKRERYVRGVEVRPGNPRVAHHAIGLLDTGGTARRLDARHPGPGYPGNGPGFLVAGLTPGYVPGQTPRSFPAESALTFKPGTDFVLQVHYHPTGKPESDQTEVGLYFTDTKPARNPTGVLLGSEDINIPAGDKSYRVTDVFVLPCDLEVGGVWAHMHMIGRTVRVWAEKPDGTSVPMLWINDWDFAWQDTYHYRRPFWLPKGTRLRAEFTYDNSADNPRNPSVPPRRVRHGENSDDEMAGLWVGGLARNWIDELTLLAANVGHYLEITGRPKR